MAVGAFNFIGDTYKDQQQAKATQAAGDSQYDIDLQNINNFKQETNESLRRAQIDNDKTSGLAAVQIGAAGFGEGSSMDDYLKTIKNRQEDEVNWMLFSANSQVELMQNEREASRINSRMGRNQYAVGMFGGIGSAFKPIKMIFE